MTSAIQHFIDIGDGVERELRYTVATARRLRKTYGTFAGALAEELAVTLPDLIFEGLTNREGITPDDIAERILISRVGEYQEIVLAAMGGISLEEYRKRIAEAEEKARAEKNAQQPQPTATIQ